MQITFTELLIFSLATWRVSSLFVSEAGPFRLFVRVREWAGITHDDNDDVVTIPDTLRAGVLSCVWCFSVWAGAFWTLFFLLSPALATVAALPFAFSAAAVLVQSRSC
jgi:hypothetical protein